MAQRSTTQAPTKVGANGHRSSLRERILAAQDIRIEPVSVPEWPEVDGEIYVRSLTGRARDSIERMTTDKNFKFQKELFDNFRAIYCALALVDADGRQIFTLEDVEALGEKSSIALQRVYAKAVALSAINAEDVDGMTEDLKDDPSASSGSD